MKNKNIKQTERLTSVQSNLKKGRIAAAQFYICIAGILYSGIAYVALKSAISRERSGPPFNGGPAQVCPKWHLDRFNRVGIALSLSYSRTTLRATRVGKGRIYACVAGDAGQGIAPRGGETICRRRWQFDSRRIYVRPRTGPQSAHLWWPAVDKLQAASVPIA